MRHLIRSGIVSARSLLLVLVAGTLGFLFPRYANSAELLVTPLVIFLVFSSLRDFNVQDVDLRTHVPLVGAALGISYLLLPLGGMQIGSLILTGDALIGFGIMLAVPTTAGSAIIWTQLSDGDTQLATIISIASLVSAPLVTPLLLVYVAEIHVPVPLDSIISNLAFIVVSGIVLARLIPSASISESTVDRGAEIAIFVLLYTSVGTANPQTVSPWATLTAVSVSLLLLAAGLSLTGVISVLFDFERGQVLPVFYTGSFKNLGIALLISFSFSSYLVVLSIVSYYVTQQLVGAVISDAIS